MNSLNDLRQMLETTLEQEARRIGLTEPVTLYDPIHYALKVGGKRLRPVMLLMACELFGGKAEEAMPAALGIEIFHNFTLLHDDIMDKAIMRRNQPSVHIRYSTNAAILSGDAMSNMAYQYLLKTRSKFLREIISLFAKTATEVCEGQQLDMDFENLPVVSIDNYLRMIRLKTAVLFGCSLKTGALIAGTSIENAHRIYDFGIHIGLAFQLQDDLLDIFAEEEKLGKKLGGDILANKKTFLLLKSLELASPRQKEELLRWIGDKSCNPGEKIAAVKNIYNQTHIRQYTSELID
ncbi:MAG: polyprenyl synthetase family protein, partial [Mangrovibacterium sp.]